MNYLAHLLLAQPTDDSRLGAIIGDFMSGRAVAEFTPGIQEGILLHRRIDEITDAHPVFRRSRGRVRESVGRFAGVVVDVVYDHFLARDWDRWHSLFAEGATLSAVVASSDGYRRVIMTPESSVERSGASLERDGFFETEINRVSEGYGMIAHVFSTYESYRSRADDEPFARGINSFQLMNDGSRWWVVSVYWQGEGAANPIPAKYLPGR